jgi:hypothetical protein
MDLVFLIIVDFTKMPSADDDLKFRELPRPAPLRALLSLVAPFPRGRGIRACSIKFSSFDRIQ